MRYYYHRTQFGPISIDCLGIHDLMVDSKIISILTPAMVGKRDKVMTTYRKLARRMTTHIINEFMEQMLTDLIMNNNAWSITVNDFPRLQIGHTLVESSRYKFDTKTCRLNYRPVFIMNVSQLRTAGVQYYFDVVRRWKALLNAEVEKGHRYQKPEYEHIINTGN